MWSDDLVFIGLAALTFVMMWWRVVNARSRLFQNNRSTILRGAGGFCVAMAVFFVAVNHLHLGKALFGWMKASD